MKTSYRRVGLAALLMLTAIACTGCFLVPFVDSFNQMGVTKSDRANLLPQTVKKFSEALYWGELGQALAFVDPDHREKLAESMRKSKREERIVASEVESTELDDSARKATVVVKVRSYKVPYYI